MKKRHTSCLTRLLRFILVFALFGGIIFYVVNRYIYMTWDSFKHPQISDVRGIDVSKYQQQINWNKVKKAKIDDDHISFVLIKATEGAKSRDAFFKHNFRAAGDKDIIRGAYHFWSYRKSAESQAKNFINTVTLRKGDLPPVLDTEEFPKNYDVKKFRREVLKWLDIIERHYGVTPIIYANHNFKRKYLNTKAFDRYPLWLAHYGVKRPIYMGEWKIWQYSQRGRVSGINHDVDLNVFNGSYDELLRLTKR